MSAVDGYNGVALGVALATSLLLTAAFSSETPAAVPQIRPDEHRVEEVTLPGGGRGLRDASGTVAPLRRYTRIASVSLIADQTLWELCEPERVVAVTRRSKDSLRYGYRYANTPGLGSLSELEPILALEPELLLANHFGDPRYAARLRERGIVVFDLGQMRGLETLLPNIEAIGTLIGKPREARAMAQRLVRRLQAVAATVPQDGRPRALYLSKYGHQLFGGTRPTSYHDILVHAGLVDVAADRYEGWPQLSSEQVLALSPDVIVTKQGMGEHLCAHPGMHLLGPCRGEGRLVELDVNLIDDPGPIILEMTEALHEAVHGTPQNAGAPR